MSSNNEVKGSNFKKGLLDLATLDSSGKQPLSQVAIKPSIEVIGGQTRAWSTPNTFAINSLETDGTNGNGASIPFNATYFGQTNNVSAFVWVKIPATNGNIQSIFAHSESALNRRKWHIYLTPAGRLAVIVSSDGTFSPTTAKGYQTNAATYADNEWHHFGFTFSSNVLKIYLDGQEITGGDLLIGSDGTVNTLYNNTTEAISLNYSYNSGTATFTLDGAACHYTYLDKQLSNAEVLELYNQGRPFDLSTYSATANVQAWLRTDGDTTGGGIVTDYSGNSQNATIIGTAAIISDAPPSGGDFIFGSNMYLEVPGLAYTDNTIPSSASPLTFLTDKDVAYVTPNLQAGGGNLTVTVDTLDNVPAGAVVIARRDGAEIIVGTSYRV